jgi:hypothetical protein
MKEIAADLSGPAASEVVLPGATTTADDADPVLPLLVDRIVAWDEAVDLFFDGVAIKQSLL